MSKTLTLKLIEKYLPGDCICFFKQLEVVKGVISPAVAVTQKTVMWLLEFIKEILQNPAITALLGTIIGGFITYIFTLRLSRNQMRQIAALKLREAFSEEIAILHPYLGNKNVNAADILTKALPKHHAAVAEFRFYLSKKQRANFDQAWIDYYSAEGDDRCAWFTQYEVGDNARRLFQERVGKLLSYAKE